MPITVANLETAMCLWEAVLDLRLTGDLRAEALIDEAGTSGARHTVLSWIDQCEDVWEQSRAEGIELIPYDWEHCPAFLSAKLDARYPDLAKGYVAPTFLELLRKGAAEAEAEAKARAE